MATIKPRYTETHCGWGHELTEDNIYQRADTKGVRCKICRLRGKRNTVYGAGAADWCDLKILEQDGKCAICKEFFGDKLCLDHNHDTGEWRGMVCKFCNLLIGWVEKRREAIMDAENYLNYWGGGLS